MAKIRSSKTSPKQFVAALTTLADFFSEKQERMDRATGEVRMVDLNGATVRSFMDTQCWKLNQLIGKAVETRDEIARRAAYYARSLGSRDIQTEDLERVAEQLEDANMRLATIEEGYRLACKAYEEVVGKSYMPPAPKREFSKAGDTQVEAPSPSKARLLAALAASAPNGVNKDAAH